MKLPTVRKLPSGRYNVRLRIGEQDLSKTFDTEKDAVNWATSVKAQYKLDHKKIKPTNKTVRQLLRDYVNKYPLADNTRIAYRTTERAHFQSIMDQPYASVVNWQRVVNNELQTSAVGTVRLSYGHICAAARDAGLEIPNVRFPSYHPKRKSYIPADEIPRFMEWIKGRDDEIAFLLMLSSCRISEALTVCGTDIAPDGIQIRGTKTAASFRFIPWLIPRLKEIALPHMGDPAPVVKQSRRALSQHLKQYDDSLTCHSLRKTYASLMYSKGVPAAVAMRFGGWSSISTMQDVYIEISNAEIDKYRDVIYRSFT